MALDLRDDFVSYNSADAAHAAAINGGVRTAFSSAVRTTLSFAW